MIAKNVDVGVVKELLPQALLKVQLESGEEITAHVAEEFRRVSVPLRAGVRVRVQRAENDPRRGSIVGVVSGANGSE